MLEFTEEVCGCHLFAWDVCVLLSAVVVIQDLGREKKHVLRNEFGNNENACLCLLLL